MKKYLKETTLSEVSAIMKMRLHMVNVPGNYGNKTDQCPLCGVRNVPRTEHFFRDCWMTRGIAEIWDARSGDMNGSVEDLKRAMNHLKKV